MFSVHSYRKLQTSTSRGAKPIKARLPKSNNSASAYSRLPPVPEQPKTKPALTMKVKELRNWLSELGDRNQKHYHRFHERPSSKTKSAEGGDDLLGIQSKPSMASSCPSTAILEGNNDPFFANSFSSEDENSSTEKDRSNLYQGSVRNNSATKPVVHSTEGVENISSKEHLQLLLKQAPTTRQGCSYSVCAFQTNSYEDDRDDLSLPCLHKKPSLFRDQIVTKETLDTMSGGVNKTLGEHLAMLKEHQTERKQKQDSKHHKDTNYHGDDEADSDAHSNDSTDTASISPSVLVSKMANVFLNNHSSTLDQDAPPLRRRFVDPRELAFLRGSTVASMPREDLAYANPPKTPTSIVGKGIRKFGGPHKTLVERRTEQLHQKFGENRSAFFVQKKTWGQKTPHGKYERTTRVEKIYY